MQDILFFLPGPGRMDFEPAAKGGRQPEGFRDLGLDDGRGCVAWTFGGGHACVHKRIDITALQN